MPRKITMRKHIRVLLSMVVKTLTITGNVEIIKMLNRFGHACNYSKLLEIDKALCLQKSDNDQVPLPLFAQPGVPTVLAYDNIDMIEETLSEYTA